MKGFNNDGSFMFGRFSYPVVREAAAHCSDFVCVIEKDRGDTQERVSCYNCVHRQWAPSSFVCLKQQENKD